MHQIKGTNSSGLVIPELNIKSCSASDWESGSGGIWQQRSTKYDRNYWISGGWFHPSLTETKSANIAGEDYDQSSAAGYSAVRFYAYPIGGNTGYSHIAYELYRSGGQKQSTISLPASDPDQWFHYMAIWEGGEAINFFVNGKNLGSITYSDAPYITAQNRSNSNWTNPMMSRRYAGGWQRAQTYSGGVYSYFIMDLSEFKGTSDFQNIGMDPNDKSTYYKPWMEMNNELIVPITDEDWTDRKDIISTSSRGLYITIKQDGNDVTAYYDNGTYTSTNYPRGSDSTYSIQPVYGYTL